MRKIMLLCFMLLAPNAHAFPAAEATTYDVKLRIGDTLHHDVLVLKGGPGFRGPLSGTFTVPGVFTSDLTGTFHCHPWNGYCQLQFEIIAREHGSEFKVLFRASTPMFEEQELTGEAHLEDGTLLGSFTATRRNETAHEPGL